MSIVLQGSTSGSVTLQEPAVAGTTTLDLPAVSGTVLTTGSSGQSIPKAALPTGSVLQVVTSTSTSNNSTSGGVYADTGLTASITPTSSSSKILVLISATLGCSGYNAGLNGVANFQIVRGSTSIYVSVISTYNYASGSGGISAVTPSALSYLDSPATTSSTTYKLQYKNTSGSSAYFNTDSGHSTITLLEIAQ